MTDSNESLERGYRRMLRLYPRSYRDQHGEDMLGVLLNGADGGKSHPGFSESLDLLRGALVVRARYWWQMRSGVEAGSLAVRHPLLVIRVRLAVALWLCVVTTVLCARGYWWLGVVVAAFIPIHLVLAGRVAARRRVG